MKPVQQLHVDSNPSEADLLQLKSGLQSFNRQAVGQRDLQALNLVLRNQDGLVVGGLIAETIWQWLLIQTLWLSEEVRGLGQGAQLLSTAERLAIERGCLFAALETFSFQSPRFYYQQGYRAYGQLDYFPKGHTRFSLWKPLQSGVNLGVPEVDRESQAITQLAPQNMVNIEQSFFALLYQTSLDMLERHDLDSLLQTIVDQASSILDSPYAELMLVDADELVVRAFTRNQTYLLGDRVRRGEALVSWRAHDTGMPAIIDNYSKWAGKRVVYGDAELYAVGDFPIMAGDRCLGVLGLGRVRAGHAFSPTDIEHGIRFSRLAAMVIDHAQLHETARKEIATRKLVEDELRQRNRQLAEQNSELDAYAHSVAHDLKNPLTTILGTLKIVQAKMHELPQEQLQVMLGMADRNAAKMQEIIEALLLMGSVRKESDLQMQELDMGAIVKEVLQRLDAQIRETAASIDFTDNSLPAMGIRAWVEQVLMNYLSNALKYGGEPPHIEISCSIAVNGMVRYSVADRGPGVKLEDVPDLFEAFERCGNQSKEGHGVGLSLVKRIVNKLGGEVAYRARVGGGSEFSFELPAVNLSSKLA